MVAHGTSQRQIARELGYTEGRISIILSKPEVQTKIEQIRRDAGLSRLEKRFEQTAPLAMDYLTEVVRGAADAKSGERLDASKWLLEKVTGKPKQATEHDLGAGVLQLLKALDERKEAAKAGVPAALPETIDVTPAAPDPLAEWVTANIPEAKQEKG